MQEFTVIDSFLLFALQVCFSCKITGLGRGKRKVAGINPLSKLRTGSGPFQGGRVMSLLRKGGPHVSWFVGFIFNGSCL